MSYQLPDDVEEPRGQQTNQQMSSTTKYIMNNTEFAMMG